MLKLFAIAAIALNGTPAFADPTEPRPTVRVAAADLDLGTPAGIDRLDRRLAAAVRKVCPAYGPAGATSVYNRRDCLKAATLTAAAGRNRLLAAADTRLAARGH